MILATNYKIYFKIIYFNTVNIFMIKRFKKFIINIINNFMKILFLNIFR